MKRKFILILISLALIAVITGCSQTAVQGSGNTNPGYQTDNPPPVPGNEQPATENPQPPQQKGPSIIPIAEIIEKSADYVGKDVVIEGKIIQECGSGCWFNLKDQTGVIYVDLAPSNLAIPQKVGSRAKVYGVVTVKKGVTYIIGKKVEF